MVQEVHRVQIWRRPLDDEIVLHVQLEPAGKEVMATRATSYSLIAARCVEAELHGLARPSSPVMLASLLTDNGARAGDEYWTRQDSGFTIDSQWQALDDNDARDAALVDFFSSRDGLDKIRMTGANRFVRRDPSGVFEVDNFRAPNWMLPAAKAGSRDTAQAGYRPLLLAFLEGDVSWLDLRKDAPSEVHRQWVFGYLDKKWETRRSLMVPFRELAESERAKDRPYAEAPIDSMRRVFVEINRLAGNRLIPNSGSPINPGLSDEEAVIARHVLVDLVTSISPMLHASYRAHFLAMSEPRIRDFEDGEPAPREAQGSVRLPAVEESGTVRSFSIDLTNATSGMIPQRFRLGNQIAALQMIVALTDLLAVREAGNVEVSGTAIINSFLEAYVRYQDTLGDKARVTTEQRIGSQALPADEYLLNARMAEMAIWTFRTFIGQVHAASSHLTAPCLVDPFADQLDITQTPHLASFGGLALPNR